jgi:hypothetical protein
VALPPGGRAVYLLSSPRSCWKGTGVLGKFGTLQPRQEIYYFLSLCRHAEWQHGAILRLVI